MKRLSIVIPVYNNEEWLDKCFSSIYEQTFTNYEVIVVDDISTDNGMEIIKEYQKRFNDKGIDFKVIVNESKRLSGGTRNVGILNSIGEYILCIDCDDWLVDNEVFEKIDKKLNGEDVMFLDYIAHQPNYDLVMQNRNKDIQSALVNRIVAIWSKVVKRDVFLKALFPEGTLYEDRIHHFILLTQIKTMTNLEQPVIVWNRLNENSTSSSRNKLWNTYRGNYVGDLLRLYDKVDGAFKDYIKDEIKYYVGLINEMVDTL